MASVTLEQTRTANLDGSFTVTSTATAATSMETAVFVYKSGVNTYDHVATAGDMIRFPAFPDVSLGFHRRTTVTQTFDAGELEAAKAAALLIKERVSRLAQEFTDAVAAWVGTDTTTYTGT